MTHGRRRSNLSPLQLERIVDPSITAACAAFEEALYTSSSWARLPFASTLCLASLKLTLKDTAHSSKIGHSAMPRRLSRKHQYRALANRMVV
jgi:hypothetical protein